MSFNQTLPFSSDVFFGFMALVVLLFIGGASYLKTGKAYKWLLTASTTGYILLLYPKPLNILALIGILYWILQWIRKHHKSDKIVKPMLLLAIPMIAMKIVNIIPPDENSDLIIGSKYIFQIAGVSYIVFKVIGLFIDERRNSEPIDFIDFYNFTAFVPTLLIGPIDRYRRFNKDVERGFDNIDAKRIMKALNLLIRGLLYKFIIAELIKRYTIDVLVNDGGILYHFGYMYSYLIYLFFDFAGYSLLAISFGNFLGIDVPINFNKPFLAVNPKEFWKRWHKSLGDWLGDYFFKPIFKDLTSRKIYKSIQRQNIALFATFSLMGFWNGFQLHFILSGMLFGVYSVIHNYYIYKCKKNKKDVFFGNLSPQWIKVLSIVIMFNAVAFAIYIFSGNLI